MFSTGWGWRADAIVRSVLDEIRESPTYKMSYCTDERGGFHPRGGGWNNPDRAAETPFTKAHVDAVVEEIRRLGSLPGVPASGHLSAAQRKAAFERVDAVLVEAYHSTDGADFATLSAMSQVHEAVKDYWKAQRRERSKRLKAVGVCVSCCKNPTAGTSQCHDCGVKANERAKRRKAATTANPPS